MEQSFIGYVEAIYFENPTNLYKVIRVVVEEDSQGLFPDKVAICTGQFPSLHFETSYQFQGELTVHPRYGEQFAVQHVAQVAPTSDSGLIEFLSGPHFPGIGKTLAKRIVECFSERTLDVILNTPEELKQVRGLTSDKRETLHHLLVEHRGTERIYLQLAEWGFGAKISEKIVQQLRERVLEQIEENPYILVHEVQGVGFAKADQLAEHLGINPDAHIRLMAGLVTSVNEWCNRSGDTYVAVPTLFQMTQQLLERSRRFMVTEAMLETALQGALQQKLLFALDEGIMVPSLYFAETGIAKRLQQYLKYEAVERFSSEVIHEKLEEVSEITGITYDEAQRQAMLLAMQSPLSIITGGPGTGKTTLVRGLLVLHRLLHEYDEPNPQQPYESTPVLLAAPTGRAAKRMQEMTNIPASTIHRLIGYTRESSVSEFEPLTLDGQLLIVDEMSMVDTWLMHWLCQAIPEQMQVILVGDKDQLPSVGPGRVFADLIQSETIPTIELTTIYRQADDSSIVHLAHDIRQGRLPADLLQKQVDRSFISCGTQQVTQVVQQIVSKAQERGYDETTLQVLAPMYKGLAGINALNVALQNLFNPKTRGKAELQYFDQIFREGDKVLQLVNNADEGVYNGDIGKIIAIYNKETSANGIDEVIVSFDEDKELTYKKSDLEQLTLAYCCSVHKSQGSEYPLVILPLVEAYHRMLRKDLVYTAVTRAKSSLVLLGNPQSFVQAVQHAQEQRRTNLMDLLSVALPLQKQHVVPQVEAHAIAQDILPTMNVVSKMDIANDNGDISGNEDMTVSNGGLEVDSVEQSNEFLEKTYQLLEDNLMTIDPMIGMEGISPYDFM